MLVILRVGVISAILLCHFSVWGRLPPATKFQEEVNRTFCHSKLSEVLLFLEKYPEFEFDKMYAGMRPIWQVIDCDLNDSREVFKLIVEKGAIPAEMVLFSTLRKRSLRFTALILKFGTFTTWNAVGFDLLEMAKQTGHKALYQMVLSAKNASQKESKPNR